MFRFRDAGGGGGGGHLGLDHAVDFIGVWLVWVALCFHYRVRIGRGFEQLGTPAGDFDGGTAAVIEDEREAVGENVERDDEADESDPFDGVVEVEVDTLS